jgi:hypothetical protein
VVHGYVIHYTSLSILHVIIGIENYLYIFDSNRIPILHLQVLREKMTTSGLITIHINKNNELAFETRSDETISFKRCPTNIVLGVLFRNRNLVIILTYDGNSTRLEYINGILSARNDTSHRIGFGISIRGECADIRMEYNLPEEQMVTTEPRAIIDVRYDRNIVFVRTEFDHTISFKKREGKLIFGLDSPKDRNVVLKCTHGNLIKGVEYKNGLLFAMKPQNHVSIGLNMLCDNNVQIHVIYHFPVINLVDDNELTEEEDDDDVECVENSCVEDN